MLDAASQVMLSASAYDEASVANAQDAVVQFAQLLDVRTLARPRPRQSDPSFFLGLMISPQFRESV